MDIKSMAKSKRSHTQHHHPKKPPKTTSSSSSATSTSTAGKKDRRERKRASSPPPSLPSNWDRYEDENQEDEIEVVRFHLDSYQPSQLADSESKSAVDVDIEVIVPKSKGADFRDLIAQAKESRSYYSPSFDDKLPVLYYLSSWFYRIKPSVTHEPFKPRVPGNDKLIAEFNQSNSSANPTQLRWKPVDIPEDPADFIDGLQTVCGAGSSYLRHGYAVHMYTANKSMDNCAFCNADGDFLFVPQKGRLWITTECGRLQVSPGEVAVVPQGFRFAVSLPDGPSRGYVAEIFGTHFQLPDLGPIGANGLAAARDFLVPIAWFEESPRPNYIIVQKYGGELFTAKQDFSPFNVVAWHGNYVPYKYDLSKFCPYNTVLVDHGDPSVNTVLTAPTDKPGVALLDFVIFPPRWLVAEHTFRPPYYHRNCMSEFMGLIYGGYEAKAEGFLPGGASLHSCMTPHGPDTKTYEATIACGDNPGPYKITDTMAFMFESYLIPRVCSWALESPFLDCDYYQCWIGLQSHFRKEDCSKASSNQDAEQA